MKNQNKKLSFGNSFTLGIFVLIASISANLILFCILAAAGTTPPLKYTETSEPKHIINLNISPSIVTEQAEKKIITDITQLDTKPTYSELPEPVLETISSSISTPDLIFEDVTLELPGLAVLPSNFFIQTPLEDISVRAANITLSVSEVDILPSKISGPVPQYPKWAQRDKLESTVTLRFIVTEKGNVENINIHEIEGDERFGTEAVQAANKWHFSPAIKAGKPVSCWCFQKIEFKLPR
jgi:TonB family protein